MKKTILILVALTLCLSMTSCAGCNVGDTGTTQAITTVTNATTIATDKSSTVTTAIAPSTTDKYWNGNPDEMTVAESYTRIPNPNEFISGASYTAEETVYDFEKDTLDSNIEFDEKTPAKIDDVFDAFYFDKMHKGSDDKGLTFNYMEYAEKDPNDSKHLTFNIPADIVMDYLLQKYNVDTNKSTSEMYNSEKDTFVVSVYTTEYYEYNNKILINSSVKMQENRYKINYDVYFYGSKYAYKLRTKEVIVETSKSNYKIISAKTIKIWRDE